MDAKNHDKSENDGLKSGMKDNKQSNGKDYANTVGKKIQMNGRMNQLNAEDNDEMEPARKRLCDNE